MKTPILFASGLAALIAMQGAAAAQSRDGDFQLPQSCLSNSAGAPMAMDHSAMGHGQMHGGDGSMPATAETGTAGHAGHADSGTAQPEAPEHVRENMRLMAITMSAMEQGMANENADIAFACGMIAHHQAAIDMAEVQLRYGTDGKMRDLAQEIIEAQTGEIETMKAWLQSRTD
ncbi:DUF305 domain-containing protein [Fulvimarina endophytica]|uniref:DUF305 domain-containing protein n=1 Tax=Fulvimarina endophytica TaxID=2293836 RepID=A0A371X395_9HYPH|nr:DUF305 domain-containing protein [Fulvimarina endophytica]RFC63683.1 DUF305 domain-containing protein [Fulvimarina endophytica]